MSPVQQASGGPADSSPQERPLSWSNHSGSNTPTHDRGYLGATSFGAVIEEARTSLSLLSALDLNQTHVDSRREESNVFSRELTPPLQEMCLYVLRCLAENLSEDSKQPDDSADHDHGWEDEAVDRIINSLRSAFAQSRDQGEEGLKIIAERISRNTERPLRDDVSTKEEWLHQFCGENLRWESLGLLWASLQRVSDILHSICCRHLDWLAAKYSTKTGCTCLDYCVTISRHLAEQNILLLDISRRRSTLESIVCGEAHISDEDLASDAGTLNRAVASLDANGWNTKGAMYSVTVIRARAMIAHVRDELVEIALSHNISVSLEHLREIKAHQYRMFSEFPQSLMYQPEDLTDPAVDIRKVYVKVLVHLEHLKNIFLAERLLMLHGEVDNGDIIVTSFAMLKRVLLFWTNRERFYLPSIRRNFEWHRVLDHHLNFGMDAANMNAPMQWGPMSIPDFNFDLVNTFDWVRSGTQ
ncbi:hypothetical protein LQW54_007106 [Pestalotiopsis sp. IQ-011]